MAGRPHQPGLKTHKRFKERLLIGRNRTKRVNFRGSPLFQAMYNIEKQTTDSTYLVSNRCWEAGGRKRERDWLETSWINCFSVFMLYAAWKRGLPRKIARFVLFCPIKSVPFNLLCVLGLFSECWQSTLFQIFIFFFCFSFRFTHWSNS